MKQAIDEKPEVLHEIEIPMLPPSVNSYWKVARWGKRVGRYITPEGVRFKNMVMAINRGQRVSTTKALALEIELHSSRWLTNKGTIHKRAGDCDNHLKSILDSYFAAIGLDDSSVFELSVCKLLGDVDRTVIRLYEFELL